MRMRPDQVPEPSQPSWPVSVPRAGLVTVLRLVRMTGLVTVTSVTQAWLRISHDTQDARIIPLQHLDNNHPHATAKHPQPGRPHACAVPS